MILKKIRQYLDGETKLLIKNSSWVLGGNMIRAIVMFAKGIIISRGLGVELYGIFNLIAAFALLIHQFFQFTLSTVLIKFGADFLGEHSIEKFKSLVKAILGLSLLLCLLSNLIIYASSEFFYQVFFDRPNLQLYIIVFGLAASTAFIDGLSLGLLRLFYKFKQNSVIVIINVLLELIIISIVLYVYPNNFKYFLLAVVGSKLISSIVLNGSTLILIGDKLKGFWKASLSHLSQEKRQIRSYIVTNSGSRILKNLLNNGDVLLLGALTGPAPVAFYNIAKKLAQSILIVVDPITSSMFPQLSHLITQRKFNEVKVMLQKVTKMLLLPSLIFMAVLYWLREDIIQLAYGSEFVPAAEPFVYLAANAILAAILFWNLPMLLSMGLVNFRFKGQLAALIVGIAITYLTVPSMGASGVALGLLIANGGSQLVFSLATYIKLNHQTSSE